ncbi:MAG: MarR family winged helix-turn-helix transcriptional regulator [Pseudomonadota bacterium]
MTGTVSIDENPSEALRDPPDVGEGMDFKLIELLFFAYRDFVSDADDNLSSYGFGRAHHRVLHFVNRRPGLSVAELLEILQITKQSLGPILKQLVYTGFLVQEAGTLDRRQRLLYPTQKGRNLSFQLMKMQSSRIQNALNGVENQDRELIERFLFGMIEPDDRTLVENLLRSG